MAQEDEQLTTPEPEADGYYGDEELEDGELDLSFLDEDEQDEAANDGATGEKA